MTVATGSVFPTTPDEGELFSKQGDGFYCYENSSWKKISTLANGQAKAAVAATGSSVFVIVKNGTQVGTITFAASSVTATISIASNVLFAIGDVITIVAPATADATLSDVDFTLVATQN